METFKFAIINDWPVLLPIVLCSLITVAVAAERWWYYRSNRRDIVEFINWMQRELLRNNLEGALSLSNQLGGVLGEVSEMGVRALAEPKGGFERQFDITANLATRKLERNLPILGTIATVSPYLGLFGTVVRILLTFGEMSKAGGANTNTTASIMLGIGSALIATAFGLAVAISAVGLNNYFHTIVGRWEEDFQLLKLLFLSVMDVRSSSGAQTAPASSDPRRAPAPSQRAAVQQAPRSSQDLL